MEQDIYITTIHLDRATLRHSVTDESVKQLADSIRDHGLLQAIVVAPRAGGGYRLIAGRRRLAACVTLGYTTIPARIIEPKHTDEIPALAENLMRLQMNPLEEAKAVRLLQEHRGLSIKEISEQTNHGTSWVQDRLALLALSTELQQAVEQRHLSISAAFMLDRITDLEYRNYLIHVAKVNGASVSQCEAWYLEWDARVRLANPAGLEGPIPQLPPRPYVPTCACACCGDSHPIADTLLIRICPACNLALRTAKAETAARAASIPTAPTSDPDLLN